MQQIYGVNKGNHPQKKTMAKISKTRVTAADTKLVVSRLADLEHAIKSDRRIKELFKAKPELVAAKYGLTEDLQTELSNGISAGCGSAGTCEATCDFSCLLTCALTSSKPNIQDMVTRISKEAFS
ncbi:MAG: hypothetical protein QM664_08860 [Flavihumibacter sp.]